MAAKNVRRRPTESSVDYRRILRHLTFAYAASITAELALKHQSADRDLQIAETLRLGVIWPISEAVLEIEKLTGVRRE